MKTFSPFGKGYKSSWYRYPSLASLTKAYGAMQMKADSPTCGCDNCRMERRKAENFPEYTPAEAAE